MQIYKIYMNQSALIITDFSTIPEKSYQLLDKKTFDFSKVFHESQNKTKKQLFYIQTSDPKAFFSSLKKSIKFLKAAGGLVKNNKNEYLFIKRLGKWDLPKGKLEKGEEMKEAAVREVEEECGVKVDVLGKKIKSTYHSYMMFNELIIKKTNWYEMEIHGNPTLTPQAEEDITQAEWLTKDELNKVRLNTYPLINDLLEEI